MKKDPNNKFRKIRRLNNLTQAEEAKLLDVSIHHISEFENASPQEGNGSMDISLSLILKISSLYNVPADYFFSDEKKFKIRCLYSFIWLSDYNMQLNKCKVLNQYFYEKFENNTEHYSAPERKSIHAATGHKDGTYFYNNLRFYRNKANINTVELSYKMSEIMKANYRPSDEASGKLRANPTSISLESVKKIESNVRNMTIFHVKAACELFNIPLYFLVQTDQRIEKKHFLRFYDALIQLTDSELDKQIDDYLKPNESLQINDEEESK